MKKQSQVALISVVAVLAILSYCHFREATPEVPAGEPSSQAPGSVKSQAAQQAKARAAVPPPSAQGTEAAFLPTQMEDPARFEALQKGLQEMATCLNMKMGPLDPQSEFNYETLNEIIAPDLGAIVMRNDEWFATDIRTAQGEVRRIYLEMPSTFDDSQRSLKYYSMSPNGGQKEIQLSDDQAKNPSDTLLASLESDGTVIGRSKSQRTFYENGDGLLVVEKNGKIFSFQLPHDDKVFSCTGIDSAKTLTCRCR